MTDPIASVTAEAPRRGSWPRPDRNVCLLLVISLVLLTACAAPPPPSVRAVTASPAPSIAAGADPLVAQATADLARRTGRSPSDARVLVVERRVWPDASLGCPQPGQAFASVLTPGYRIVLAIGSAEFVYRASERDVVFCPADNQRDR